MVGMATSTCPSGWPASLVILPVIVTGSCAASRAGSARNALRMKGMNRRGVNCMSPPARKCDTHRSRLSDGPAIRQRTASVTNRALARRRRREGAQHAVTATATPLLYHHLRERARADRVLTYVPLWNDAAVAPLPLTDYGWSPEKPS